MTDVIQDAGKETEGHLVELDSWSEDIARQYASEDNMELNEEHLEVLHYLRKFYDKNGREFNARIMLNALEFEFGQWEGKRRLYQLFPKGPVAQGCKYAGIPLPPNCNDLSFGSVH
ncbi:MAG: TusE/DsrC/DsvC family sulfur relay protein [Gammaproteobacteria bacterium]|nr:TusE/DsrC/DsvC family sulfur relay protein [Gammaproteobacteria bacterium]